MYAVMPSPGAALTGDGDPDENNAVRLTDTATAIQEMVRRNAFITGGPFAQK